MQSNVNRWFGCGLLAAAIVGAAPLRAAQTAEPSPAKPAGGTELRVMSDDTGEAKKATRANRYPIRGKIKAIDLNNRTLTLSGSGQNRVFVTDAATAFTRNGKPAKLEDGVPGEEIGGLAEKQADGTVLAVKVRFGPKPAATKPAGGSARKNAAGSKDEGVMNE
jgi:hypothetical protein